MIKNENKNLRSLIVVTLIIFLNLSVLRNWWTCSWVWRYSLLTLFIIFFNFSAFLLIQQDFFGQVFLLVSQDASSNIKRQLLEGLKPILMFQVLQGGSVSVSNMFLRTQCLNLPFQRSTQFTYSEAVGLIALPAFWIEHI